MTLWMVRAGRYGEGESEALAAGIVGIGWAEFGDLTAVGSAEEVRARLNLDRAGPRLLASHIDRWPAPGGR